MLLCGGDKNDNVSNNKDTKETKSNHNHSDNSGADGGCGGDISSSNNMLAVAMVVEVALVVTVTTW